MGLTLIKALTASSSSSLDFVDGTSDVVMDNTYNEYQFYFVNMHPATDSVWLTFQANAHDGSSQLTGFNETMTSTYFRAYHYENDSSAVLQYQTSSDQGNGTAYQRITTNAGYDDDQSVSGILTLYAPSSTTYVKHFIARSNSAWASDGSFETNVAGYINTTSAIDEISFKFSSGNTDAGVIKMYGLAKS